MKAMVYDHYGSPDVLSLREIELPNIQDNEVLVKVFASSINWLDWHLLTGEPFLARILAGLTKPKNPVLGIDLAGRVEVVGSKVTRFRTGDEVFGSTTHGCFAEFVSVSENSLVTKPSNLSFEEAAAVPGAANPALQALRDQGKVQPVQKVLINGASGGVGTFAVQIAKSFGAEVTGVCSTNNLVMVRSIGADHVVDYTQTDFTQGNSHYDVIFDAVAKRSFSDCQRVLTRQGTYITTKFSPLLALQAKWISMTNSKKLAPLPPKQPSKEDHLRIKSLIESSEVKPVIDRSYTLEDLPKALRYLGQGHTRGKIVITI